MTPAADDQLAAVLREIAEMEAAPGFKGRKIIPSLAGFWNMVGHLSGLVELLHWSDDAIVGEILRACESRSKPGRQKWQYYMKWPKAPEGDYQAIIQVGPLRFEGRGDSLALAAATAYRDALKAGP